MTIPPKKISNSSKKKFSLNNLTHVEQIQSGGFGQVSKMESNILGKEIAVKRIKIRNLAHKITIKKEVDIHSKLKHPNIPELYGSFISGDYYYVLMELVEGKDLKDRIIAGEKFSTKKALDIILSVIKAVRYLHSKGFIHFDIKSENIMISDSGDVKLVDFGTTVSKKKVNRTRRGTNNVFAPEQIYAYHSNIHPPPKSNNDKLTAAVDVWAIGVVLYHLLRGYHPFNSLNNTLAKKVNRKGNQFDRIFDSIFTRYDQRIKLYKLERKLHTIYKSLHNKKPPPKARKSSNSNVASILLSLGKSSK